MKVEEIKAKFAERFQILEETNPTQILPVYANANFTITAEILVRSLANFYCQ